MTIAAEALVAVWIAGRRRSTPALLTSDGTPGAIADPEPPADDRPEAMQQQADFLEVIFAAQAHFGDKEPTDEEVKGFLRQRMIDQGKTPEEADRSRTAMDAASQ